jgi:4-hydroxybenzoate polyprenyltransferase
MNAAQGLSWVGIARLGLVQAMLGAVVVLTTSTLNRVMVVELALPALLLYAGAVFWTMGYDTIYAIQDFDDDGVAGIRSTARLFGDSSRLAIGLFYALAVVAVGGSVLAAGLGLAERAADVRRAAQS